MKGRYEKSEQMLERALQTIPLGTQTFSKSTTQYPFGVSPYFLERGQGSRVWDVDGNEYIDFVNALAAITLGYNDTDVNAAVARQLQKGSIFTLSHPLEFEVAEKITAMVPCAEMVRFGKNGADATSGAVRLARAYTGRDHIAACGYHGWQDWYIGTTTRSRGIPRAVRELTHPFNYNDSASLEEIFERYPGAVAAVIMEPMNIFEPEAGFLEEVKDLAHRHGALLIFDETITGFRLANGGAQELFGVTPDLATFGKGLANGFPLSAITGKKEVMRLLEEVFFSFTYGGEALSLAASLATMTKLQKEPVIEHLYRQGNKVMAGVTRLIEKHGLQEVLSIRGNPSWTFFNFSDAGPYTQWQIKTFLLQELFARGILMIGTHNMTYAHSDEDLEILLEAYDQVFFLLREGLVKDRLASLLHCEPIEQLFRIR